MRKRFVGNYVKVAVIAVSLAVASSCALAGTFAAFSATYTWRAESGEAGDVAYRDTAFSLDLFDDGYILPGDSGSAEITGVDFKDTPVVWSFEVNAGEDRIIPIVFYLAQDGTADITTYYSAYDFSQYEGFVRVGGDVVSTEDISVSPDAFTAALGTGKSVCWAWPDTIYTDQNGTVDEVALAKYQAYCAEVCDVSYACTEEAYGGILKLDGTDGTVRAAGYVTAVEGERLLGIGHGLNELKIADGLLKANGGGIFFERAGRFDQVRASEDLEADSTAWLIVPKGDVTDEIKSKIADVGGEVCGNYAYEGDATTGPIVLISDENGSMTLVKLPPVQTGVRASVSVTVSAVVTF